MTLPRRTNEVSSLRGRRPWSLRAKRTAAGGLIAFHLKALRSAGLVHSAFSSRLRREILRAEGALNDLDTLVVTRNILRHTHSRHANTYPEPSAYFLGTDGTVAWHY